MYIMITMCLSTICLILAAYYSFRLIGVTKSKTAWTLISMSIFVQIIRRLFSISSIITEKLPANTSTLTAELIALVVSLLLMIGTANIAPLFLAFYKSEARLRKANAKTQIMNEQLEIRVKERTLELEKLNQKLNLEIQEHMKSKDALILKDRQAVVGQMAAGIAHEVKNPLTAVRGFAQILSGKVSNNQELRRYAGVIIEEVDSASSVINNFLKFSRPSAPKLERILLIEVIKEVGELVKPQSLLNNVNIKIKEDTGSQIYGLVDEKQIKQVFLNIFKNSIEAMPNGGTLKIQIGYEDNKICINIADNGCGISKESMNNMFVPFFTTKAEGTGLGMFVSQAIIEAHKGKISILSNVKSGTQCLIYLPDTTDNLLSCNSNTRLTQTIA